MSDVEVLHPDSTTAPRMEERYAFPDERDTVTTGDRHAGDRRPVVHHRAHDLGQLLRGMFAGVILAALVALGIDNRQEIQVGYVFGDGKAYLWMLLAAAAVGGMLFGWLIAFRSHRAR
jgi:uncharacterized integral membrane protein